MFVPQVKKSTLIITIAILAACSASQNDTTETQVKPVAGSEAGNTGAAATTVTTPRAATKVDELIDRVEQDQLAQNQRPVEREQDFSAAPATVQEVMVSGSRVRHMTADTVFYTPPNTENYDNFDDSGIHLTASDPLSTFSIDVDTGAYSNARRYLNNGQLPPADAVRAEEFINYFAYDYPQPENSAVPFSVFTEVAASPYREGRHLVHIGIKGKESLSDEPLHSNLVFLVDVSGSMNSPDKLELLKTSLKMLTRQLSDKDSIALVVYAGASGVVLEPTPGDETRKISAALDRLQAGGSTNGGAGIELAYSLAQEHFIEDGINRVILATDGDFNVGTTHFDSLIELIEEKRETGIGLTTLGFGTGNYNDHLMEQLADAGNGNYAYIDNLNEARKVLVDEGSSTLQTIARDVKIQIEFNPAVVSEYRLIGYENRALANEDFNNDKVDAGEIGAGHTVTAIYEISLAGSSAQSVDPLRYGSEEVRADDTFDGTDELAYLKLRYKEPDGDTSKLIAQPVYVADINSNLEQTSDNYRFSAAVAGLAQLLRDNDNLSLGYSWEQTLDLANSAKGEDPFGYRSEFINLVKTAQVLTPATR